MRIILLVLIFLSLGHSTYSLDKKKFTKIYQAMKDQDYVRTLHLTDSLKEISSGDELGKCYYIIGYVYERKNNVGLAMKNYLMAIEYFTDLEQTLRMYNNIGDILTVLALDEDAIKYFDFAITHGKESSKAVNYAYFSRARALSNLDMHDEALADVESAERLAKERGDNTLLLKIYVRSGYVNRRAKKYPEAFRAYEQLLLENESKPNDHPKKSIHQLHAWMGAHNAAFAYLTLGDTTKGLSYYDMALNLSMGDVQKFETMKNLGDLHYKLGDIDQAKELLNMGLSLVNDDELLGKASNLEIFKMLTFVEADLSAQVALLNRGNDLLTQYSKQKDDVIKLHDRNLAALSLNSHYEVSKWRNYLSDMWFAILAGLLLLVIIVSVVALRLRKKAVELREKNKAARADLDRVMELLSKQSKMSLKD